MDAALEQNIRKTPQIAGQDRHELGLRVLQDETGRVHYDGSDVVVIAFEGTGSFHPRKAAIAQSAAAKLQEQGLRVDGRNGSLTYKVSDALDDHDGYSSGWSGLTRGPLEQLIRNPNLDSRTQWLSFASEEVEAFRGLDAFKEARIKDVLVDSYESLKGETPGIENAIRAVRDIREQAKEQGKDPEFLLVSHSSGGRSMVKFLRKPKSITEADGRPMRFRSAMTIDPVREAHEAFFEGGGELIEAGAEHGINHLRRSVGLPQKPVHPPAIQHRLQPESLYKPSNVESFVNFYQLEDVEGLKMKPYVGIHGSPVEGACNLEVEDVGPGGHGEIAVHPDVREAFVETIKYCFREADLDGRISAPHRLQMLMLAANHM